MEEREEVVLTKQISGYRWKMWLGLAFVGIFLFIFYTSFLNPDFGNVITGNVIREEVFEGVPVQVALDVPDSFNVNGLISKIEMKIQGGFSVDGKSYDLESASLIIDNFNGEVGVVDGNVVIDGGASKIFVEGIPISGKLSVDVDNKYSYLKLTNFYIAGLDYDASGIVRLNDDKVVVNLDDEEFSLDKFKGDLEVRGNSFKLKGITAEANAGSINVKAPGVE